jgi:hypothetical protein
VSIVRTASVWLLAFLLGTSLIGFFAALSAAQLTSDDTGKRILRRSVAVSTEIDALMPQLQENLRAEAESSDSETVQVPGYPIPVDVTRQEALTLTTAQLRDRILSESADVLFDDGMSAFGASDPEATRDLERLSPAGAFNEGLGRMHDTTHTVFLILTVALGLVTLGLAVALFLAVPWDGRLLVLGGVGLLAALPLLAAAVAVRFAFRTAGPDTDPFVNGLFEVGADGMWVPIRNYFTLAMVSFGVMMIGSLLLWWEARNVTIAPSDAV